jgi:hypothetical protein
MNRRYLHMPLCSTLSKRQPWYIFSYCHNPSIAGLIHTMKAYSHGEQGEVLVGATIQ